MKGNDFIMLDNNMYRLEPHRGVEVIVAPLECDRSLVQVRANQRLLEEYEHTKEVIGIRISKRNTQHNCQKKKYKRTNNELQNIHIKLKNV